MKTPICDFVKEYAKQNTARLHMPGHKGKHILGFEHYDITEIKGADSLFEADGIIAESEKNASSLFGCDTYYSTEGSSLCIRAMMYLAKLYATQNGKQLTVFAARNVHKTFLSAAALLDFDIEWLKSQDSSSYLSFSVDYDYLEKALQKNPDKTKVVYITSPDYLGNVSDVKRIADICHSNGALLFVDNAHGAYLRFLEKSEHPIDLGADICCDSAHKTLPVITGGAYLHISDKVDKIFKNSAKNALALFGSTSPSYLILQSLDYANKLLAESYFDSLKSIRESISCLRKSFSEKGYALYGNEALKITVQTKKYGYTGYEFADLLRSNNIECEFADADYIVLMFSAQTDSKDIERLKKTMLSIPKKNEIVSSPPVLSTPKKRMTVREAMLSPSERLPIRECIGRTAAISNVSCPPAVPIVISGEIIDESTVKCFEYYGIEDCLVTK